jgi:hypothetical protein
MMRKKKADASRAPAFCSAGLGISLFGFAKLFTGSVSEINRSCFDLGDTRRFGGQRFDQAQDLSGDVCFLQTGESFSCRSGGAGREKKILSDNIRWFDFVGHFCGC